MRILEAKTDDVMLSKPEALLPVLGVDGALLRLMLDQNPSLVFLKDSQYRILYGNKALLEFFPPDKRDGVIGRTGIEDFSKEDAEIFLREDKIALEEGYAEIVEEIVDWQGRTRFMHSKKRGFTTPDGQRLMFGISVDVTGHRERERALAESNRLLSDFAAVAAHDLRSPLASYVSSLEFIAADPETKLGKDAGEFVAMMQQSATNLLGHVGRMLETYKASNRGSIDRRDADLNLLIHEVTFNLSETIRASGAKVLYPRLPILTVDPGLMRHLFHNLIENAIKYRSDEPPTIILRHEAYDTHHLFAVEDNGIGVPPEVERTMFELFRQADGSSGGAGIGLSLCKRIVELHGGTIGIDRAYEGGCRIVFTIPPSDR